ncbi:hypothetical protein B0H13DRAFT_1664370 [Mycena leptocephala]|nr:hypothetical protein B0H13DRAFT_1664370 [Mycena leptocephala]
MPNRRISDDLKEAMLRMEDRGRDTTNEILKIAQFSRSTLIRMRKRKHLTGSVAKAQAIGRGRPRTLLQADADYLVRLARHNPTLFLDEYRDRLERYRHLPTSLSTIHRTFLRARMKLKAVQKMASERCPLARAGYSRRIAIYPAHYLISIDEVSKDDRTYARIFGRAEVGMRCEVSQPFTRKRRLTGVAALALGKGIIGAKVVEGSLCRESYVEFLRDSVVCDLLVCSLKVLIRI